MKRSILAILCLAAAAIDAAPSRACTSVIVSSKATRDGRPLMFKHRDTNTLDNRMEFCHGPRFRFIAVVNSDTKGGVAYYEICNYSWVKFDVNDSSVAPEGYMYYTNFSRSGVEGEYHGWERFLTAGDIMKTIPRDEEGRVVADHDFFLTGISRSYKHSMMGLDYDKAENIPSSGITVDQDFIPRKMTSCAVVFEGVAAGENPEHTVMWTILGYPACGVAIPPHRKEESPVLRTGFPFLMNTRQEFTLVRVDSKKGRLTQSGELPCKGPAAATGDVASRGSGESNPGEGCVSPNYLAVTFFVRVSELPSI